MCVEFVFVKNNLCYNMFDEFVNEEMFVVGIGDYLYKDDIVVLWLFV